MISMVLWSDTNHGDSPRPQLRPSLEGAASEFTEGVEDVQAPLLRGGGVGGTEHGSRGGFARVEGQLMPDLLSWRPLR